MSQEQNDSLCPSCGRFVGTYNRCMYCGARVRKRMPIRIARWAAVAISVVGLIVLWSVARLSEVEVMAVAEVNETMNFALVRVKGQVVREPKVTFMRDQNGKPTDRVRLVSFPVNDGTGEITVLAFETIARRLWEERADLLPRLGDDINLVGSLRVRTDQGEMTVSMFLQSLKNLDIERAPVAELALGEIHDGLDDQRILVTAAVAKVSRIPRGPYALQLSDGSGVLKMTTWENVFKQIPEGEDLEGKAVSARVRVNLYRGKELQLMLDQPFDIQVIEHDDTSTWLTAAANELQTRKRRPKKGRTCVEGRIVKKRILTMVRACC